LVVSVVIFRLLFDKYFSKNTLFVYAFSAKLCIVSLLLVDCVIHDEASHFSHFSSSKFSEKIALKDSVADVHHSF
jgi:hypothetical protein